MRESQAFIIESILPPCSMAENLLKTACGAWRDPEPTSLKSSLTLSTCCLITGILARSLKKLLIRCSAPTAERQPV